MTMSDVEDWESVVVVDNGSGLIKAGIAGEDAPQAIFSNLIGSTPRQQGTYNRDSRYVSNEIQIHKDVLRMSYPMTHGIVTDWSDMEYIWHYMFDKILKLSSKDQPMLITEPVFNPKSNRQMMSQVLFETFQVPALTIANSGMLVVMAMGRSSAISLECGDGVCQVVPIYEGYTVPNSMQRFDLGGRDLTQYLSTLLTKRGYSFSTTAEMEIVRDIKEKLCYTALDFEQEMVAASSSSATEKSYELPDGSIVTVGNEKFRVPECMFQPALLGEVVGKEIPPVQDMINRCLQACDFCIRADLCCNIIASGGNTMIPGFGERLTAELRRITPSGLRPRVLARPERKYFAWIGGSILASLSMFRDVCTTKANYEEYGPSLCYRKCF